MTLNPIGRAGCLAAAGLVAVGLAACGAPAKKDSVAAPSPAVSLPPPDRQSCTTSTEMAQLVEIRVVDAKANLDIEHGFALSHIRAALDQVSQARTKVTAPQVKAIVQEYHKDLYLLTGAMEGTSDKAKNLADIEASVTNLAKLSRRLSEICAGMLKDEANPARTATCGKIDEAVSRLYGPYSEFEAAGNDSAKLKETANRLLAALEGLLSDLGTVPVEPGDGELRSAVDAMTEGARSMRSEIIGAGSDPVRLQRIPGSGHLNNGSDKLARACHN